MNKHEQGLAARRRELVERSTAQRAALVASAEPLARKAAALDRIVASVRRYPFAVALAVGAVALVGPRKLFDLGARAITLYLLLKRST
jgi:YqjK-like protein